MADPYRYFRIEANEITGQLEQGLLELERAPQGGQVARLLRLAHTLKGAARIVKHGELAELAHELEDALAPLRGSGAGPLDGAIALVERIASQVAGLTPPIAPPGPVPAPLDLRAGPRGTLPPETQRIATAAPAEPPPVVARTATGDRASDTAALPRVDPGLLDHLIGELGELHTQLAQLRAARPQLYELDPIDRGLRTARRTAEQLRLLPANSVLGALERTARDAAHVTGKQLRFVASGGEIRVDARVLTGLSGALVQLVRNAVVHGLESPADRVAAGKPPVGQIAIEIRIVGDRVIIQCDDDGAGIDLAAVRLAAIARGQLADSDSPTADALIALLLRGGLSTARGVTPLAGRGIGLDVVSDAARAVGGHVTVRTTAGKGTSIALEAPCSVISLAALSVVAGGQTVALPQAAVRRVLGVTRAELNAGAIAGDSRCRLAPLARILGGVLGLPTTAVVISDGGRWAALAIDRVVDLDHLVVRPLDPSIPVSPVVRGVALDGAGVARPVLDPAQLIAAIDDLALAALPEPARRPPILVVDDSLTTRTLEQSMLEAAGYEVDVASSAEAGLERAGERAYGLFLVDVEMPGLDGFGFISALRARSQTPAVLVTSRDTLEDRMRGETVGAQGYLVKGALDQGELLSLVARLLA
jgi:two-component system chemotaxis sensor kinase CheA